MNLEKISKKTDTDNLEITHPVKHGYLVRNAFSQEEHDHYEQLLHGLPWKMQELELEDELFVLQRETLGMADTQDLITGTQTHAILYPGFIHHLREKIKTLITTHFEDMVVPVMNYCWMNRYRDKNDYVEQHKDNEDFHRPGDPIISITFGDYRYFDVYTNKNRIARLSLGQGDIFIMLPEFHELYYHSVPPHPADIGPRINLTFRSLVKAPII